ncbi:MAG: DUF3349 domain-containing protein [Promicromonosporaceae bacterium]|nr:DUF3349 domain-containing protein [Promicromonosporaceae bacterium]
MNDDRTPSPGISARIIEWLRAGYPEGVDPRDYPAVLAVLSRRLTESDLDEIAGDLAVASAWSGEPITAADVHRMVQERAFQSATPEDLERVSARLAAGGWPLSAGE